jgi:5-methylcytosine-specific restriction endonuclease McrA
MSFPQDVINAAWKRAGGRCECKRQCPEHLGRRCNKELDPKNNVSGKKWHAHHIVSQEAGGSDTLENCEILCIKCHENTQSYGG